MKRPARLGLIVVALLSTVVLGAGRIVTAAVTISLCGPDCVCIDYSSDFGSHIEVRCGSSTGGAGGGREGGWTTSPPTIDGPLPADPGSFGGNGNPGGPTSPAPCSGVQGPMALKLAQGIDWARGKLARVKAKQPDGSLSTFATSCTHLFKNSPLRKSGLELLDTNAPFHAIFRSGEGSCTLPNGDPSPCRPGGPAAVTTCCAHSPYIFLCDTFSDLSQTEAGVRVIHELLHVSGQREDGSTATGPGDPPTTNQLNDIVRAACQTPQVITTEP